MTNETVRIILTFLAECKSDAIMKELVWYSDTVYHQCYTEGGRPGAESSASQRYGDDSFRADWASSRTEALEPSADTAWMDLYRISIHVREILHIFSSWTQMLPSTDVWQNCRQIRVVRFYLLSKPISSFLEMNYLYSFVVVAAQVNQVGQISWVKTLSLPDALFQHGYWCMRL